jgi:hypothetical protein
VDEPQAAIFTSASTRGTVSIPVTAETALPERFPWLLATSSGQSSRKPTVSQEFALFADEALEWAALAFPAGLEVWPDDWTDQQQR